MFGWPGALVIATGVSGLLAFGVIPSAFAPQAQALFYVFAAVLLGMFAAQRVLGGGHGGRGHGHGEGALVFSGRAAGTTMIAAGALAAIYFWNDNDLSAEKIGRAIDGGVTSLSRQVETTYQALRNGEPAPPEEEAPQR